MADVNSLNFHRVDKLLAGEGGKIIKCHLPLLRTRDAGSGKRKQWR